MKADESADCAGTWEGRLLAGLSFFFRGLEIEKAFLKTRISAGFRFSHAE
jgi:hypothetical protein